MTASRRASREAAAPDLARNAALQLAAASPVVAEAAEPAPKPRAGAEPLHVDPPHADAFAGTGAIPVASADLPPHAIVLVGPMAAGKTSIGRRVARELGIPFIDSDARIVQAHGPIPEIFEQRGEPAFREIEAATIAAELAEPGARILALGGGAVLADETRELLRQHPVILLMTTERAVKRTANLTKRPLLRDDPGAWSRILEERRPVYEAVADVTFRTDRASKEQLVRRIAAWILNPQSRGTEDEGVDE
ncbi:MULTISPECIES: shikimate kinase [unclassified Leucobacter]|uniref:shikimate kinase n=1 Tax=unclassified Leucobacter TaxID=2621730 RepID=UPI001F13AB12|nr:shikimate kinase [Leucobacter sp. CX169]